MLRNPLAGAFPVIFSFVFFYMEVNKYQFEKSCEQEHLPQIYEFVKLKKNYYLGCKAVNRENH